MAQRLKFILWVLPFLGVGLGYAYAYMFFHGLLIPWQFVGKPGEDIGRILGIREGHRLLIATETGELFSFEFNNEVEGALPPHLSWEKEQQDTVDPVSHRDWGPDLVAWSLPFQVDQLYEIEYLYKVEGKGAVKFALDTNGNLWIWSRQIAGLTGLVFYFYPVIGFLIGLVIILVIKGVNWLR